MTKVNGQIMVDIKWVIVLAITSFMGLLVKDFYGLPSKYAILEREVVHITEGVGRLEANMAILSKDLNDYRLLVKAKGKR